jgi:hypothetical protein
MQQATLDASENTRKHDGKKNQRGNDPRYKRKQMSGHGNPPNKEININLPQI